MDTGPPPVPLVLRNGMVCERCLYKCVCMLATVHGGLVFECVEIDNVDMSSIRTPTHTFCAIFMCYMFHAI